MLFCVNTVFIFNTLQVYTSQFIECEITWISESGDVYPLWYTEPRFPPELKTYIQLYSILFEIYILVRGDTKLILRTRYLSCFDNIFFIILSNTLMTCSSQSYQSLSRYYEVNIKAVSNEKCIEIGDCTDCRNRKNIWFIEHPTQTRDSGVL